MVNYLVKRVSRRAMAYAVILTTLLGVALTPVRADDKVTPLFQGQCVTDHRDTRAGEENCPQRAALDSIPSGDADGQWRNTSN